MADDDPKPEGDASDESGPASESIPDEPQSLSDTEADIKEFLGSEEPQGETRIHLEHGETEGRA